VQERHRDKEPGLAAFDYTLIPIAQALIAGYDGVRNTDSARFFERVQGKALLKRLHRKLRMWVSHVAGRVEGVNAADFGDRPGVPEDLVADTKVFLERVKAHASQASEPLPFVDELVSDLTEMLDEATSEWRETEDIAARVAELRRQTNEAAAQFEQDLISYRRALASVIGRGHPDFQKLRIQHARTPDKDDDANAPESSTPEPLQSADVTPLPAHAEPPC
jgi:hypothetical protein